MLKQLVTLSRLGYPYTLGSRDTDARVAPREPRSEAKAEWMPPDPDTPRE